MYGSLFQSDPLMQRTSSIQSLTPLEGFSVVSVANSRIPSLIISPILLHRVCKSASMFSTNASSSADYVPLITTVNQSEDRRWKESSRPEAAQTSATQWILTALISIVAISSALFSFNLSSAPSLPLDPAGLEKLKPYPNLEKTSELFSEKNGAFISPLHTAKLILFLAPKTWFPNTIVHTSSVEPDKLSTPSSHVLLSSTVSVKPSKPVTFHTDLKSLRTRSRPSSAGQPLSKNMPSATSPLLLAMLLLSPQVRNHSHLQATSLLSKSGTSLPYHPPSLSPGLPGLLVPGVSTS